MLQLDCTAGIPWESVIELIPWSGRHGFFAGRVLVEAVTPFGCVVVELYGRIQDNAEEPERISIGAVGEGSIAQALAAAPPGVPVLVVRENPQCHVGERRRKPGPHYDSPPGPIEETPCTCGGKGWHALGGFTPPPINGEAVPLGLGDIAAIAHTAPRYVYSLQYA